MSYDLFFAPRRKGSSPELDYGETPDQGARWIDKLPSQPKRCERVDLESILNAELVERCARQAERAASGASAEQL